MLKADFHIHSRYSFDSSNDLEAIIRRCQKTGINCVAIADHGTAEGGLRLKEIAPFKVIVAEEILTPHGEIMGMFLKETVPTNISIQEAIARIREQDGLVCVPHPFDIITRIGLGGTIMEQIVDQIDIIEVFNARSPIPCRSSRALAFANRHNLVKSAGSDAHTISEIGKTYVEMPDFESKGDFLAALRQGVIHRHMASPFVHFSSVKARFLRLMSRKDRMDSRGRKTSLE